MLDEHFWVCPRRSRWFLSGQVITAEIYYVTSHGGRQRLKLSRAVQNQGSETEGLFIPLPAGKCAQCHLAKVTPLTEGFSVMEG